MATVTALDSFYIRLEKDEKGKPGSGRGMQVSKGQNFDSNHPAVKAAPKLFGAVEMVHPPVEQATAAPGQPRNR